MAAKQTDLMRKRFLHCRMYSILPVVILILPSVVISQTAQLSGTISDAFTKKSLSAATITLLPGKAGTVSDSNGVFSISVLPGTYSVQVTAVSYEGYTQNNLVLNSGNITTLNIELTPASKELETVIVSSRRNSARAASLETPLSIQRLTTEEIKANPGGNFDISKVIQSLPGVGGGVGGGGFRNDIIIRGGAPSENVFYLDGIEVPVINHFGTQGAGGGPQGILNVSFIEDVKLSSSAFDARYDNALSSVFQFKQKQGNKEKLQGNFRLSGTETALTLDGPLSEKTTFLASARRSYLQVLFKLLDLPIRPNYWDFQFKTTTRINDKNTLNFIGIGAIDEFSFAAPKEATPEKLFVINSNPIINQWNYTIGATLQRLIKDGYINFALSRNTLNNKADRYQDNESIVEEERTLLINSRETENKLRVDATRNKGEWKYSYGASLQFVEFKNDFFQRYRPEIKNEQGEVIQEAVELKNNLATSFLRYGLFAQAGRRFINDRLSINLGVRSDGNTLSNSNSNLLSQLSPRIAMGFALGKGWQLSGSYGLYYRLPSYTQMAYVNQTQAGIETNPAEYIRSEHVVSGIEFSPSAATRFTLEGFLKRYSNYPVSILDGISLANKGTDFGAIGNEPVVQDGKGRAYGVEFFAQQKLTKRFFGILSYTWYRSEFTNLQQEYTDASWDNRHLLSFTWGYKFRKNWELGLKFRYQGGAPYTPYDELESRRNFLTLGNGVFNYANANTQRLNAFHASDVRIDKKWNFKRFTLDVFLDVQNWYAAPTPGVPNYTFARNADNTAFITTDGNPVQQNGSNAIPMMLLNNEASVLPTLGFVLEF